MGVSLLGVGCATTLTTFHMSTTPIQQVELGQTMEQVTRALGAPHQLVSDERTGDGRYKVVWRYDAAAVSERSVTGKVNPPPDQPLAVTTTRQTERMDQTAYLVVFLDGRVSEIIEQR